MKSFKEYSRLDEKTVNVKQLTNQIYKLQDNLDKIQNKLIDLEDEGPEGIVKSSDMSKFDKSYKAFSKDLETIKTALRKSS